MRADDRDVPKDLYLDSPGVGLYPALHMMERTGWIKSSWKPSPTGRRARFYALTAKGRKHLASGVDEWQSTTLTTILLAAAAILGTRSLQADAAYESRLTELSGAVERLQAAPAVAVPESPDLPKRVGACLVPGSVLRERSAH